MKCHISKLLLSHLPHGFPSVTAFRVGSCYTCRLAVIRRKSVELLTGIDKTSVHWHCFLYNFSLMPPSLLTCWCQYQRIPFSIFIMAYQLFSLVSKGSNFKLSLGLSDMWNHFSIRGELFPLPHISFQGEKWPDGGRTRMLVCVPTHSNPLPAGLSPILDLRYSVPQL